MRVLVLTMILMAFIISTVVDASEEVAKVIMLRGDVQAKSSETSSFIKLKNGSTLQEGAKVKTGNGSIVKFLFFDKSQLTVGPNSEMEINSYAEGKVGMLTLLQGKMQSQISKSSEGGQEKLLIKTPSAALGVRGTDFLVSHNLKANRSSTLTFSGHVAFVQTPSAHQANPSQLINALRGSAVVNVMKGQFSGTSTQMKRANVPVKISPAQFEMMKKSVNMADDLAGKKKSYRSPVPSGVDATVVSKKTDMDTVLKNTLGSDAAKRVKDDATKQFEADKVESQAPAEGFVDSSGAYAPKAGGYVDIETGTYIAPPEGSQYDEASGTYTVPANIGGVNESGQFIVAEGLKKTEDGSIVVDTSKPGVSPASVTTVETVLVADMAPPPPPPPPPPPSEPKVFERFVQVVETQPELITNQNTHSTVRFNIQIQ